MLRFGSRKRLHLGGERLLLTLSRQRAALLAAVMASVSLASAQADTEVFISSYFYTPTPSIPNSVEGEFTIEIQSSGPDIPATAELVVDIARNVELLSAPSGCSVGGTFPSPQQLTCNFTNLPVGTTTVVYNATARDASPSLQPSQSVATVTSSDDNNPANNTLGVDVTVQTAADLTLSLSGPSSAPSGGVIAVTASPRNEGPDASDAARAILNIPAASDYDFTSATGTDWTCSPSGAVVTCDYSGAPVAANTNYPDITLTGQVVSDTSGTVTFTSEIQTTSFFIPDPDNDNNTDSLVVTVTSGTDLSASKSMPDNILIGEPPVAVNLAIENLGPQDIAAGATIVDTFSSNLTVTSVSAGCVANVSLPAAGPTVTCTANALNDGASQPFQVFVEGASASTGAETNTASVAPPSGVTDPNSANDTASAGFQVFTPFADLSLEKTKSPNPFISGSDVTSSITVRNNGVADATYDGTTTFIRVVDTLDADESFDSTATDTANGGVWSCSLTAASEVTCETVGAGVLADGGTLSLTIITTTSAGFDGSVGNTACTTTSNATPADTNTTNDCDNASAFSSTEDTDLAVEKTVGKSAAGATAETVSLASNESSYYIRLRARNLGTVRARNVRVSDTIPRYLDATVAGVLFRTAITEVDASGAPVASPVCNIPPTSANVVCAFADLDGGTDRDIYLRVDRPFNTPLDASGAPRFFTNTASIFSPDTTDPNPSNNSDSADISAAPLADITITNQNVTPDPSQVGRELTYTVSVRNVGPNQANDVVFTNPIDPTKFDYVAGSASTTKPGGSCAFNAGQIECDLDRFNRGQSFQVSFTVFAKYPFMGLTTGAGFPVSVTNTASVTTTTDEDDTTAAIDGPGANANTDDFVHDVTAPSVDLAVVKGEPAGAGYDPVIFEDECLTYDIRVSNIGASRATGVQFTDTPTPETGFDMTFVGFAMNPVGANAGFSLQPAPNATCAAAVASTPPSCIDPVTTTTISSFAGSGTGDVTCSIDPVDEDGSLDQLDQTIFRLYFRSSEPGGGQPAAPLTFIDDVVVSSLEERNDGSFDQNSGNNSSDETTTVLPKTDLIIHSKAVNAGATGPFNINEPIPFDITFSNDGPSPTTQVIINDPLPSGFVFVPNAQSPAVANGVAPIGAARAGEYAITSFSCTGTNSVTCVIDGNFPPNDLTATNDRFVLTVNARAAYPFSGPFDTNIGNTATISVGQDALGDPLSRDFDPSNNAGSTNVQIQSSSIAGSVFNDIDRGGATDIDASEGISGVTVALSGTDIYGNAISAPNETTSAAGGFTFADLPPGTYTLVETQPSGFFDVNETAPGGNGTVDNASYSSAAAQNTISDIALGENSDLTGYLFQEFAEARVRGFIYSDLNNDGILNGAETGIPNSAFPSGQEMRLTGTDYAGNAINLTQNVNSTGLFNFAGLPPSQTGTSYTLTQINAPNGFVDGLEFDGTAPIPGTAGRPLASETMDIGQIDPGDNLQNRNFGEIAEPSISGFVYIDNDEDAIRDPGETAGLANSVLTLTGTNDLGQTINCSITTTGSGAFSFANTGDTDPLCQTLRPSDANGYTLAETSPPGLTHTGAFIGSAGGSAGGVSGANTPVLGETVTSITNIVVGPGDDAENYNFGETGQALLGAVYVDANNNGVRDTGEQGIPGVDITISGTTDTGQDLCTLIGAANCTATTDASGDFAFFDLPGSNAAGYTLAQQPQNTAPLNGYGDGQETVGVISGSPVGTVGADSFTNVVLNGGDLATGYLFGEIAGGLSGSVYVDNDDDGSFNTGDAPIENATVVLSGNTVDGQDICTLLAALNPARSCTVTTAADGSFSFPDLPAPDGSGYTLTETQPAEYADGREAAGSPAGSVDNGSFTNNPAQNRISGIALAPGQQGTGYGFGERGVVVSGRVFIDINRDGVDDTEDGLGGVEIILRDSGGNVVATTTTASDGSYSFVGLPAGDYVIEQTQPTGYGSSTGNSVSVTLAPGATTTADFGETVSTLTASTYVDVNDNGLREPGEIGVPGVEITLTGTNDAGDPVSITLTTDNNGDVTFTDLLSGTYTLTQDQPVGFSDGIDAAGSFGGTPGAAIGDNIISDIVIPVGDDGVDYLFGEGGQAVSGTVYADNDRDGVQGVGDPGIAGVTITLRDETGAVVDTTVTDANGFYRFPDVEAGNYTIEQTQPAGYGDAAENPSNVVPIAVGVGIPNEPVNFGERTGSLSGQVFNDVNGDGVKAASEPGIPNVEIRITGTDDRGDPVDITTTTDGDGNWEVSGLVGGDYTITETQPAGYEDRSDFAGDAGGAAGNDVFSGVTLNPGQDAGNYRFTEGGDSAAISGSVWRDANHDRARDSGETALSGWTVELFLNDALIETALTDADGAYQFMDIAPGAGYRVQFRHPDNNVVYGGARTNEDGTPADDGVVSAANPGGASITVAGLESLTLLPGETVPEQSLPVDPSGVVYNAVTSDLNEGAVVTITGPAGFDPDQHLVGGAANAVQTTGADGLYQFLLLPGAPAGDYALSVTPPVGAFNPITPSSIIPPCAGPLSVGPTPDPFLVQASNEPPAPDAAQNCTIGGAASTYFLAFSITPGVSANIINNHLPIDPILEGAIIITKTTPKGSASRGDLVPYVITAQSTLPGPIVDIDIIDRLPAGFKYVEGSGQVDGTPMEPVRRGRNIVWPLLTFDAEQTRTISFIAVVGAGVTEGTHVNEAFARNVPADAIVSNTGEAPIRIVADPDVDCTDIIGKVWDDRNANGRQDKNEPGIAGARLATVRGLLVTADNYGRYHITCPEVPNEKRGSNFILKLDPRSLPAGYRMTTDNPETVRLTRGKFVKMNFGATQYQVVRLDVSAAAFDGEELTDAFARALEGLAPTLEAKPSVLRISYIAAADDQDRAGDRIDMVRKTVKRHWKKRKGRPRLIFESETISVQQEGGAQ